MKFSSILGLTSTLLTLVVVDAALLGVGIPRTALALESRCAKLL